MTLDKVHYTAKTRTTGGRDGKVSLPGMDRQAAQALVDAADQVCTYSRATRGNIDVTITVV